jgi:hypothetical protein
MKGVIREPLENAPTDLADVIARDRRAIFFAFFAIVPGCASTGCDDCGHKSQAKPIRHLCHASSSDPVSDEKEHKRNDDGVNGNRVGEGTNFGGPRGSSNDTTSRSQRAFHHRDLKLSTGIKNVDLLGVGATRCSVLPVGLVAMVVATAAPRKPPPVDQLAW